MSNLRLVVHRLITCTVLGAAFLPVTRVLVVSLRRGTMLPLVECRALPAWARSMAYSRESLGRSNTSQRGNGLFWG